MRLSRHPIHFRLQLTRRDGPLSNHFQGVGFSQIIFDFGAYEGFGHHLFHRRLCARPIRFWPKAVAPINAFDGSLTTQAFFDAQGIQRVTSRRIPLTVYPGSGRRAKKQHHDIPWSSSCHSPRLLKQNKNTLNNPIGNPIFPMGGVYHLRGRSATTNRTPGLCICGLPSHP